MGAVRTRGGSEDPLAAGWWAVRPRQATHGGSDARRRSRGRTRLVARAGTEARDDVAAWARLGPRWMRAPSPGAAPASVSPSWGAMRERSLVRLGL